MVCFSKIPRKKSGKRDSDPRPQPWQGCALPTELFPPVHPLARSISLDCGCKGNAFFGTDKFFKRFFSKKHANPSYFGNLHTQIGAKSPVHHHISAFQWQDE